MTLASSSDLVAFFSWWYFFLSVNKSVLVDTAAIVYFLPRRIHTCDKCIWIFIFSMSFLVNVLDICDFVFFAHGNWVGAIFGCAVLIFSQWNNRWWNSNQIYFRWNGRENDWYCSEIKLLKLSKVSDIFMKKNVFRNKFVQMKFNICFFLLKMANFMSNQMEYLLLINSPFLTFILLWEKIHLVT